MTPPCHGHGHRPRLAVARSALLALSALAPSAAHADRWSRAADKLNGGAWLHYEATGLTTLDTGESSSPSRLRATELILAGVRLHGFISPHRTFAYHVGIDLAAGSTLRDAGFAYDVALFPVGIAMRLGRSSFVSLGTGVGAIGAVGSLDDAVTLPIELTAEIGGGIRLLARARIAYVAGADSRQSGSPTVPFTDEIDATLGLRIGRSYRSFGFPTGNGYFVGASYREIADSRFLGLTIGYSIDMATPRR